MGIFGLLRVRRVNRKAPNRADYLVRKEDARQLVVARIAHYNLHYKFEFNRIAIRNQATRWGSCSSAGNLNFNYRLVYLPLELVDYIVVHELCHLWEFNHSRKFWDLVAQTIPNWSQNRADLHKIKIQNLREC